MFFLIYIFPFLHLPLTTCTSTSASSTISFPSVIHSPSFPPCLSSFSDLFPPYSIPPSLPFTSSSPSSSSSSYSCSPFLFLHPLQWCTVPDPRWLGPPLCPDNNIKVKASFIRVGLTLGCPLLPLGLGIFCEAFFHSVPSTTESLQ